MRRKELLKKLQSLLDGSHDAREKDIDKLQEVIKELKHKHKQLEGDLGEAAGSKDKAKTRKKIEVIKLQLKKGTELLSQLKDKDGALDE